MLISSIYISANHGACPEVFWHEKIHTQSTILRGNDTGFLPGETTRELVHSHQGSGSSPTSRLYWGSADHQVRQLRYDNIVSPTAPLNGLNFSSLLETFPSSLPTSSPPKADLTSVHTILPTYLGSKPQTEKGKRTHGRGSAVSPFEDLKK